MGSPPHSSRSSFASIGDSGGCLMLLMALVSRPLSLPAESLPRDLAFPPRAPGPVLEASLAGRAPCTWAWGRRVPGLAPGAGERADRDASGAAGAARHSEGAFPAPVPPGGAPWEWGWGGEKSPLSSLSGKAQREAPPPPALHRRDISAGAVCPSPVASPLRTPHLPWVRPCLWGDLGCLSPAVAGRGALLPPAGTGPAGDALGPQDSCRCTRRPAA